MSETRATSIASVLRANHPGLLDWLPDETLFSLVSRQHAYSGYRLSSQTSALLFGGARIGTQHDLPGGLTEFAKRTGGILGSPKELSERTLLRYYALGLNNAEKDAAIATMSSSSVAHLKFRLGLLTSRFRAHHPLKACLKCMAEDHQMHGIAYWHLSHQFPGVWVCLRHREPLQESLIKSSGVGRFQWHLPAVHRLRDPAFKTTKPIDTTTERLTRFARLTDELIGHDPTIHLNLDRLHRVYQGALRTRGLLTPHGGLRLSEISQQFCDWARPLRLVQELSPLAETASQAQAQMSRILRPQRSGVHLLRHLAVIDWLFSDMQSFLCSYGSPPDQTTAIAPQVDRSVSVQGQATRTQLKQLLIDRHLSMHAAARALQIDTATAMAWAAQAGIATHRRPKKLTPHLRAALIHDLKSGCDKATAAARFAVSESTVNKLLSTEIGLQKQWQLARQEIARLKARCRWIELIEEHSAMGTSFIRRLDAATYAWLYRNDRVWLNQHSPCCSIKTAHNDRVDWSRLDAKLTTAVHQAAKVIKPELNGRKLMLWHLYQALPELRRKLGALNRLPLTRHAIKSCLEDSPHTSTET